MGLAPLTPKVGVRLKNLYALGQPRRGIRDGVGAKLVLMQVCFRPNAGLDHDDSTELVL